ncbi:MAG TPA: glycosyltransferase family 39 protein [Actinomycetota bacterium]|nr:glycosyltransferase family 39 protein [Actinomycetota bacterium]
MTLVVRNRTGSDVTPAFIERLARCLERDATEVIVADETIRMASTDLLIAAEKAGLPVRVIRARAALADALVTAAGDYVAVMDADERHPPEMLSAMLFQAAANDVDIVMGSRRPVDGKPPRTLLSVCGDAVRGITDPATPFFVARRSMLEEFTPKPGATVLALDLLLAHPRASVSELPIKPARPGDAPGVRRRAAERVHIVRLSRRGAAVRAKAVRETANGLAWKARRKAEEPWTLFAIGGILIAAALLRFWALPSLHWYGHDEAHASMAAQRMLVDHKPVLTGQPTSRGVYLGPGYYYLVAPFYALFGMSPFAGAFLAAIAGVGAVYLVWRIGRETFGALAGLSAAAIMATAPIAVYFGRFGWNPNTLPFFAALLIYALIRAPSNKRWLAPAAFAAGLAPQLHATGLILPATLGIWLLTRRPKLRKRSWAGLAGLFALPLVPMAVAELRSGFAGTRSWIRLLLGGGEPGSETGGSFLKAFKDLFVQTIGTPRFAVAASIVLAAIAGLIFWERNHWSDRRVAPAFQTLMLFELLGFIGALLWRGEMFAYWLLPWLPGAIVLFAGGLVEITYKTFAWVTKRTAALFVPATAVLLIVGLNIASVAAPVRLPDQLDATSPAAFQNVAAAADWIAERADGPFRVEVWTPYVWDTARNSTRAFDYLLLRKGLKATPGAPTLFVISLEDIDFPKTRVVRNSVLAQMGEPVDRTAFGALGVFEYATASR